MMSSRSHRTARVHRPRQYSTNLPNERHNMDGLRNERTPSPIADNLHRDHSAFNIDPDAPVLGAGGESIQEAIQAEEYKVEMQKEKNFVGGFMVGLKRALKPSWNSNGQRSDPEAAYEETPYYADDTSLPVRNPAEMVEQQHDNEYTHANSYRAPSSESQLSPSSETMHGTQEFLDDGTTAVDHQQMSAGHYVDPVLVEPQLAPDYAKMDLLSPSTSDGSLNTYLSRVSRFFRYINELPWVAESRVTVDYYPGQPKRRLRPRPAHRPILSWYNRHVFPSAQNEEPLDLDAGSSPSPPPTAPVVVLMAETQKPIESQHDFQPMILPTVPVPESLIDSGPTYLAEPIIPPLPLSERSAGRSVVYSVVNPSAPSMSSSSTSSPLTEPPRNMRLNGMAALAQSTTGYTPYQPSASQYGRPIHEPPSQGFISQSPRAPAVAAGDPHQLHSAHIRAGSTAPTGTYSYPVYTQPV
jgi:hypothetical protein